MSPKPSFTGIFAPSTRVSVSKFAIGLNRARTGLTRLLGRLAHDTSHVSIHPTWTARVDDKTRVLTCENGRYGIHACLADTVALALVTKA
jgi:hypothetical protein